MTGSSAALVVGAAGDIGQAVCRLLTGHGLRVVGMDVAASPAGLDVEGWHRFDLSNGDLPDEVSALLRTSGPIRYVFHLVGGSDADELREPDPLRIPMHVFRRTVALNLFSAYAVVRGTIELLREATDDRSYTFVSSLNALGGYGAPGYSAGKAALHGMVRSLAVPLGRDGIRINAVALGTTATANYTRVAHEAGREVDLPALGVAAIPRGRVLSPMEAATAVVSLGLENPAVTGTIVTADAGQSLLRRSLRP